jgi:hypothetical protein
MAPSHVVVDGSNIATEGRSLPSLAQLDEAVRAFLAERPHEICTVVVDATFEHRIDPSEKQMYDEALAANELLTPPAGSIGRGDKFILEIADRVGANVFSNDSFQEFHGEYEWLFDEGRLIGGKPVPGVGWVFIERTPVRGPKSRQATRAAGRKRTRAGAGSAAKAAAHSGPTSSGAELGPMPKPKAPPPRGRGRKAAGEPEVQDEANDERAPDERGGRSRRRRGRSGTGPAEAAPVAVDPVNPPLPFIEFVAEHAVGSEVSGEVVEFSSHGAYIQIGDVRCYAPLKLLGDPAPRSAREVLARGEQITFVVHAIHAARRGIDLALPGVVEIELAAAEAASAPARKRPSTRKRGAGKTVTEAPNGAATVADQAPGDPGAEQPESEATLAATKKATAKKKAPAKKAPAKKTTAAKKATAVKKAPAKKTTAKKTVAKKTVAKKTVAKKTVAKKAPAKKAPAKKTTAATKAPAKKAVAKKTPAKKTAAKKAPAKKTAAKKAPAKKTPAKKTAAKKR